MLRIVGRFLFLKIEVMIRNIEEEYYYKRRESILVRKMMNLILDMSSMTL